jgi:hypothetical protein
LVNASNNSSRREAQRNLSEISQMLQNHQFRTSSVEQPIEYRNLYQYVRSMAQGSLEIILDILTPSESNVKRPINIKPPEPLFYEIRYVFSFMVNFM